MRTIKMKSISAGPDGVMQLETVQTVSDDLAHSLVHSKHAIYVDDAADQEQIPEEVAPAVKKTGKRGGK